MKKLYHGRTRSVNLTTPEQHASSKKQARHPQPRVEKRERKAPIITAKFAAFLTSDCCLTPQAKVVMMALASDMTPEGIWRGSDKRLADRASTAPSSLYTSLCQLAERDYLEPLTRMMFGERDLMLHSRFKSEARSHAVTEEETQGAESSTPMERTSQRNSVPQRNSGKRQRCEDQSQETPDLKETLTREKTRAHKKARQSSESLHSNSGDSDPDSDHSLKLLSAQYGAEHFPIDVLQAAHVFKDLGGAAHFNMVYTTMAHSDQDVWAEAVGSVLTRWRAGEIASPRPYIGTTVQNIITERAQQRNSRVLMERERLAAKGLFRRPTVGSAPPPADDIFDAMILLDPFADEPAEVADADEDAAEWQSPEEKSPDQPEPTPEPVKAAPEPAPVPLAAPAPPVARRRPCGKTPLPVQAEADPAVIADAAQRLGLDVDANHLGSIYSGACKGRLEVFLLAVRMAELAEARSPNSFIAKVGAENVGKDDQWLRGRTRGLSAEECTEELKEVEAKLEAEKTRLNAPMTKIGGFRSDAPARIGAVINTLPLDKGTAQGGGLALPKTPRGWAELQESMSGIRGKYNVLSDEDRKACDDAGYALASSKVQRDHMTWDDWRKLGTYHAVCALVATKTRAANVEVSRETVTKNTPPLG